ncbi:antitoxin VapB family protein [Candidatus Woesearchaeota archaeon]|nr:antitoxin VapB family protein [Candidatus Woesearchaeota archaeon]
MAKTIMIADKLYAELKRLKGNDKSFSEVIAEALEKAKPKERTIGGLLKFAGIFEGDTEYDEIRKWSKKRWKEWQDKFV